MPKTQVRYFALQSFFLNYLNYKPVKVINRFKSEQERRHYNFLTSFHQAQRFEQKYNEFMKQYNFNNKSKSTQKQASKKLAHERSVGFSRRFQSISSVQLWLIMSMEAQIHMYSPCLLNCELDYLPEWRDRTVEKSLAAVASGWLVGAAIVLLLFMNSISQYPAFSGPFPSPTPLRLLPSNTTTSPCNHEQ